MNKEEFIDWIKSLGFSRTWETHDGEYSIFPGDNDVRTHLLGPKVYFTIDYDEIRIYYMQNIFPCCCNAEGMEVLIL